ncbi:MAG: TonB-dependent receptor [Sphingomonadales bacterium 32-67-7]|nr:MAG: TonB-dependent receptor [Sphingomonadales bacterium 32-67-7]
MHALFRRLTIGSAVSTIAIASPALAQAVTINVPSQDVASAVRQLARQAGIQIIISGRVAEGHRAQAVNGVMTVDEALARMLANTGLAARMTGTGTWVIVADQAAALQGNPVAASNEASDSGISDIVVTAQRRREGQQDVPISLSAFNGESVRDYRLQSLRDVSRLTPGLLVSSFSVSSPIIAVRGATNTFNQIGANKPVGVLVDDVFIARNSAAAFELFGVDSIQVLRGPQGTLFGRNVTGGVIVVDGGRPGYDRSRLDLQFSGGSYRTANVDALADVPIAPSASFRIAGAVRRHDGYGRDRLTGQELDDQDSASARGQLRVALAEPLELLIGADYGSDKTGGRTLSSIGAGDDGDRRTSETGYPQGFERKQGGVSGRLFWKTGVGELTSISAWRRSRAIDIYSNVGASYRFLTGTQSQAVSDDRDRVTTFSQEVRFASTQWDRGDFVVGAYFADEDATRQLGSRAFAAVTGATVTDQLADAAVRSRTFAIFADGTFRPAGWLALKLGGRYTWDRKEADLRRTDYRSPANNFSGLDQAASWQRFTPRAVIEVKPVSNLMAYASYARGYTAGGFNTEAATLAAFRSGYDPETVDNYEAGFKSDWLQRRLRLNVSAFRMRYRDKQEIYFDNLTRILNIYNAASATIKGIEAELQVRPANWVSLGATYGYLDTRYDNFVIPGGADNTGNRLGSAPRHKWSLSGNLDIPVGNVRVVGNAVYSHTGNYYTGATADPGLFVRSYDLVNGQIGIATDDDRFRVAVFARNLLNKDYLLIPSTQVVRSEYLGEPRTVGATASMKF